MKIHLQHYNSTHSPQLRSRQDGKADNKEICSIIIVTARPLKSLPAEEKTDTHSYDSD